MRLLFVLSILVLVPALASAEDLSLQITIVAGKHGRKNEPVCVPVTLPEKFVGNGDWQAALTSDNKPYGLFQITTPGLISLGKEGKVNAELHFIVKELKAGEVLVLTAPLNERAVVGKQDCFIWNKSSELHFGDRPVMRYIDPPLDESTKEKREETFKVYHHLYTPDGSRLATKGVGGLYTHHRGLFFGFNKITYDENKKVDIWHCTNQTHQANEKILVEEGGGVLGRQSVQIGWHGQNNEKFADEQRELTTWNLPGGTLVEFVSKVTPVKGTVKFDGDPQHAGFHFRADNEVDKSKNQTIFIRPSGTDAPGKEKNWPADIGQVNLPWDAMSFMLGDQRYTLAYLNHPANPKGERYSERTYGRIGCYFVTEATPEKPLLVRYRVWLQNGQMKPEEVAALSTSFVEPVEVTIKTK